MYNVYAIDEEYDSNTRKKEKTIVPIRIARHIQSNHIHLLWISTIDIEDNCANDSENIHNSYLCEMVNDSNILSHYCYIKDLAKLVVTQCNNSKSKIWLCDTCLHYFYSESKLNIHRNACDQKNECKITLPKKHSI